MPNDLRGGHRVCGWRTESSVGAGRAVTWSTAPYVRNVDWRTERAMIDAGLGIDRTVVVVAPRIVNGNVSEAEF